MSWYLSTNMIVDTAKPTVHKVVKQRKPISIYFPTVFILLEIISIRENKINT